MNAARARDLTVGGALGLALLAIAVVRIPADDIVWHLATARLAAAQGHWPTTNTFSYTHPNEPLFQQYPAFQGLLGAVHGIAGWEGLSVLLAAGLAAAFALFSRWSGGLATWLRHPWLATLALLALSRRPLLRPDLAALVLFAALLVTLDAYRRCRRIAALALPPLAALWANSHQLFLLHDAVLLLFFVHVAADIARDKSASEGARRRLLLPLLAALGLSLGAAFTTPLGLGLVGAWPRTVGSLAAHRHDVEEFAFLWQRPFDAAVALACAWPVAALWPRSRRAVNGFEWGLWLLAGALALAAVRGLIFFGPVSVGIAARAQRRLDRDPSLGAPWIRDASVARVVRGCGLAASLLVCGFAVTERWLAAPTLGGVQAGLGRTRGDWPDAAMAFIAESPPPGRMMNLPWSLAAPIWFLPQQPVFVDPRFESYPRPFLQDAIASITDDGVLRRLIDRWRVDWLALEHCRPQVRERLRGLIGTRTFEPVYLDAKVAIVVRVTADHAAYLADHRWTPEAAPRDLIAEPGPIQSAQRDCYAAALAVMRP